MLVFEPQNLTEDFAHVYSGDPALDTSLNDWRERYDKAHETGDVKLLPLKEGQEPTVFWLRIPRGDARRKFRDLMVKRWDSAPCESARALVSQTLMRVDGGDIELLPRPGALGSGTMDRLEGVDAGALIDELAVAVIARVSADPLSRPG